MTDRTSRFMSLITCVVAFTFSFTGRAESHAPDEGYAHGKVFRAGPAEHFDNKAHEKHPMGRPMFQKSFQNAPPRAAHDARFHVPNPVRFERGARFEHWNERWFTPWVRPIYSWNWMAVRETTCTAQDSWGNQYPATWVPPAYPYNAWNSGMVVAEDNAMGTCYWNTPPGNGAGGQSGGCHLVACLPVYY
jgi:hypothetical protein